MALREPVVSMRREPFTWRPHKNLSTDARHWDGVARSRDEVAVMAKGRRRAVLSVSNWAFQEEMRMKAKPFVISKQALRDDRCVRLMGAV